MRTNRRRLVLPMLVAVMAVLATATPAEANHDRAARRRLAELKRAVASVQAETARALAEYERSSNAALQASSRYIRAVAAADEAAAKLRDGDQQAGDRVRALYMSGGPLPLYATALESGQLHEVFATVAMVQSVMSVDATVVTDLSDVARASEQAAAALRAAARERLRLERTAEAKAEAVTRLLARQEELLRNADAHVRRLLEEDRARVQKVSTIGPWGGGPAYAPSTPMPVACPVGAVHSFVDTWGAPRSGGRRHQGTDVFAPYGSPAYAVTDGVVDKVGNGGLGGITLWIRAANGDRFYYAHNTRNVAGVGTIVKAGDLVAYVGDTGNARGTPPHVHFEAHPGGRGALNPFPFLKRACG